MASTGFARDRAAFKAFPPVPFRVLGEGAEPARRMRSLRKDIASPPIVALTNDTERSVAFPGWGKGDRLRWMRSLRNDIASHPREAETNDNIVLIPTKTY